MYYKDVIRTENIEDYKEKHKIFYRSLSSMIFDFSFLQACVDLQDYELNSDWITIKWLHRNTFENLISKVYRCFFDNTGSNSTNIFKYKNDILGTYLRVEYREEVKNKVKNLSLFSSEYVAKREKLQQNIITLRNDFIGHRLLNADENSEVDLKDIRQLVEYGCELLLELSFEPKDFYSFIEGDGNDFSREITFTDELTRKFIKNSFLSSKYISRIKCEFTEECDISVKEKINHILSELNTK